MTNPAIAITLASTAVTGLCLISAAILKGWQEWLDVKRLETSLGNSHAAPSPMALKEMAELKKRLARLEAIANGTEQEQ